MDLLFLGFGGAQRCSGRKPCANNDSSVAALPVAEAARPGAVRRSAAATGNVCTKSQDPGCCELPLIIDPAYACIRTYYEVQYEPLMHGPIG
ncbi:hypothetical protein BRADI_2g01108v3 [Brachypodium distachyon]|uniref:Uncharacterized protein n=1 Tax=Brachypodium distachyon TaxID=15368 RepID=A0A0Q3FW24_BRADI|nr:hypothetical protein BRADI_2g01108v3 [Brachypodium distachyon]PNT69830.1 hypothetical protein BRADI_2g01108v3 [Brachypodium distachyon]